MWGRLATASILCCACGRVGFDAVTAADANDDTAPVGNRAFVTSTLQAPVSYGGLAGADAVCAARANEVGLAGTFVAWLSTIATPARDRLAGARGWYLLDGEPVVDTVDDLLDSRLLRPINIDDRRQLVGDDGTYVTTGTYEGGAQANCTDFTDPMMPAHAGKTVFAGGGWNNVNLVQCDQPTRLYCFQTDFNLPLTYTPVTGRHAFVSMADFAPSSGIAAADAICTTEAQAAGLPGTYAAVLPSGGPAAARFDASGVTWVRRDGIALAPTAAAFLAGNSRAQLNVMANGQFAEAYVVTGGYPPTTPEDPLRSCNTWTDPAGGNALGFASGVGVVGFTQTTTDCMTAARVYCLQQ